MIAQILTLFNNTHDTTWGQSKLMFTPFQPPIVIHHSLKLVLLAMPHGLLFLLSNLKSSSWSFDPLEFLVVLLFMVIFS
jgi:hypothetical protein